MVHSPLPPVPEDGSRAAPVSVRKADRTTPLTAETLPVVVFLYNLRSAFNVGNIFRLAEATRVAEIVTSGYTPTPPHPKLAKTARGCDELVSCRHVSDPVTGVTALRSGGARIYGVETADEAASVWDVSFRFPAVLLFGNEALGIDPELLAQCDQLVQLPCLGVKNSINVGNCAGVVLYSLLEQWLRRENSAPGHGRAATGQTGVSGS